LLNANKNFISESKVNRMKFAWFLIFTNTIALAMEGDAAKEDNCRFGKKSSITIKETEKNNLAKDIQPNFFDHLASHTENAICTSITCIPHAIRLTLAVTCLFSKNRDLTYALMRASGVAWALYCLKVGMGDDYIHNEGGDPPFMQSVYGTSFIYSSLSYFMHFPYFTYFGALHIAYDTCLYGYKTLMKPNTTTQSPTTKPEEVHKK
jgi:hypothetical protein